MSHTHTHTHTHTTNCRETYGGKPCQENAKKDASLSVNLKEHARCRRKNPVFLSKSAFFWGRSELHSHTRLKEVLFSSRSKHEYKHCRILLQRIFGQIFLREQFYSLRGANIAWWFSQRRERSLDFLKKQTLVCLEAINEFYCQKKSKKEKSKKKKKKKKQQQLQQQQKAKTVFVSTNE